MLYEITESPKGEPLSLEAVKTYLRGIPGDDSEDDDVLLPLISAAREYCENITGRALAPQTITAYPEDGSVRMRLPRPPVVEIMSVTEGGEPVAYTSDPVRAFLKLERPASSMAITYRAGYSELPSLIRQAMLLLIGHWYTNRETVVNGAVTSAEVAVSANVMLRQYKVWWF